MKIMLYDDFMLIPWSSRPNNSYKVEISSHNDHIMKDELFLEKLLQVFHLNRKLWTFNDTLKTSNEVNYY